MSRLLPKNREEAFTHQFQDDVKILRAFSSNPKSFNKQLSVIDAHIKAYRSIRLRNICKKSYQRVV